MTDIVERLRDPKPLPWRYIAEAADEIERLRKELANMTFAGEHFAKRAEKAEAERDAAGELIDADLLARCVKAERNWAQAEKNADELAEQIERLREQHELALRVHDAMAAKIEGLRIRAEVEK